MLKPAMTKSINLEEAETSPHLDKVSQPIPSTQEKDISPQSSNTELKPFPEHHKYAFLGDHQQFSEEKLLEVLKKHKKAIGWTLADLPRINPFICMHKILLEEDARPIRQQ
ncbi:hypothetical protein CR513_61063, partial [Mucuna pruriens]